MENNKLISEFLGNDHELNKCISAPQDHTSWDLLKKVLDKIEQDCEGVPQELLHLSLYSTKKEVYWAVVEFIKQYNKKQQQ